LIFPTNRDVWVAESYNQFVKHIIQRITFIVIKWGFNLLYHQFAWMYDFAAWLVSAGRWDDWIHSTGGMAVEGPLLDIGCGQGVLLEQAEHRGIQGVGLDESPQMLRRSRKRLYGGSTASLVRGLGQSIPFVTGSFLTVTATFPAPYLFEFATLNEIRRVIKPEGSFIILITAVVTGSSLHDRMIRLVGVFFGISKLSGEMLQRLMNPLKEAGFTTDLITREEENSRLYIIQAKPAKQL
jgi:SAM-dependent methyltransferase